MTEFEDSDHKPESTRELKLWLATCNCQLYFSRFTEHGITLDLVPELDTAALKEIGVTLLGDRMRLELAISKLKMEQSIASAMSNEELQRLVNLHLNGGSTTTLHGDGGLGTPISSADDYYNSGSTPTHANMMGGRSVLTPTNESSTSVAGQPGLPYFYNSQNNNNSSSNGLSGSTVAGTSSNAGTLGNSNNNNSGTLVFNKPSSGTAPSNDKNITFILQDGSTKKVNITGCFNAQSIKRKVLKKLGIKGSAQDQNAYDIYILNNTSASNLNASNDSLPEGTSMLFDVELVTICYSPDRLEKHRIMLCPKDSYPTEAQVEVSKKIMQKYDRLMANSSKSSRLESNPSKMSEYHIPDQKASKPPSTLRNFFGQRPPSELISSNLAEYFPEARQKELEQTVRNSVRYSVRLSKRFNLPQSMVLSSSSSSIYNPNKRTSIMSTNRGAPLFVSSIEHKRLPTSRTIGEMMVNNINAIDEAAAASTSSLVSHQQQTTSTTAITLGKPPSIYSNISGHNQHNLVTSGSVFNQSLANNNANNTYSSIGNYSNNSSNYNNNNDAKSISSGISSRFSSPNHRLSIPANFTDHYNTSNNRYSRIELLSVDSDDEESDDFLNSYWDSENGNSTTDLTNTNTPRNTLGSIIEGGPKNWLQGARIGAGSFGTVYLGMNPLSGELMAVKQVSLPDKNSANHNLQKSMIEALQHEMNLLKELNHENIVRYLGSSTEDKYLNIFLEYVPGGSVLSMLQSYGPFEEPLIRNFIRQVLIGLSYLHGEDIIHRDIKGANILIDIKGTVKISDFGISKKVNRSSRSMEDELALELKKGSRRASLQGSVYWMAPEVVKQTAYTKKADIWSVGCLIVEMFTGKHPFPDFSQMQAIFKIGTHITPQIPEWCTREAKDFLEKTFELDYEKRPDAVDMLGEPFLNTLIMSKK